MRLLALTHMCVAALLAATFVQAAPPPFPPGLEFRQTGYFALRKDLRKCASPLCGGFWLKRVNQPLTVCADGKQRAECYVAELGAAPDTLLDDRAPVLVRGTLRPRDYPDASGAPRNLGFFKVAAAWRGAGPGAVTLPGTARPHYSGIENSGIVCITAPCQSFTEYVLNSPRQRLITGVDLSPAGAAPELEQKAIDTVAGGDMLLVLGITRQSEDGTELVFEAQQFYVPVR